MEKTDAVILAGDKKSSILVRNENKAFLRIKNKPSIVHVVSAFLRAKNVGKIVIVGPAPRVETALEEHDLLPSGRIKIIEQRESLIENGKAGFLASLPDVAEETDFYSLDRDKYGDTSLLLTSCDVPLITPMEIDEFIRKADMEAYDYVIGLCSDEVLSDYYPKAEHSGIRLTYFHLKEGKFRVNNMSMAKPLRIERLHYIERMYEIRYQKKILNLLKLIFQVILSGRVILKISGYAIRMRIGLYMADRGYFRFYQKMKNSVFITKVCDAISRILGTRFTYVATSYGGAALDIDHPEDQEIIEEMYDRWMAHQSSVKPEE